MGGLFSVVYVLWLIVILCGVFGVIVLLHSTQLNLHILIIDLVIQNYLLILEVN